MYNPLTMFQKPKRRFKPAPAAEGGKATSWGPVAEWYDHLLSQKGTFQKDVILPNLLRMMGIKREMRILDIACGTGFFTREFRRTGAEVIGCDISKELIDIARRDSPPAIPFKVTPAEKLGIFPDESFDEAVIILAIQNIQRYQKALTEAARVLKPGGKLFIVMNHPAFRVPRATGWKFIGDAQVRLVERYGSEFEVAMRTHGEEHTSVETVSFHRPLQSYAKAFKAAGLAITDMEEWISHKQSDSGPRAVAENNARKEIPLFLALEVTKL